VKFKVGDEVKVLLSGEDLNNTAIDDFHEEIGIIVGAQRGNRWPYRVQKTNGHTAVFAEEELEFSVKFINEQKLKAALGLNGEDREEKSFGT